MENHYLKKPLKFNRVWGVLLLLLPGFICACQAKEPPVSPAAAAFKQEVKECLDRLVKPLKEAVLKRNTAAINAILKKAEPDTLKLCRMCPFRIGVLDRNADTLVVHPPAKNAHLDFYNYGVVQRAFKNRKITQQRLFLQDGSNLYVICAPLLQGEQVVGLLALALSADEARKRWNLNEKEFRALDFNR